MVGEGKLASHVAEYAKRLGLADKVAILKPREDIPHILESTDVFVLTSSYEGAPLTILEALASGVPVVSSEVGAIREYVGNGCALIPSSSRAVEVERFAGAVIEILRESARPQFDADYFDMSRVVKEYYNVFLDVCSTDGNTILGTSF
jgi:glycosyltransferase involved in cell wall biosynthesis